MTRQSWSRAGGRVTLTRALSERPPGSSLAAHILTLDGLLPQLAIPLVPDKSCYDLCLCTQATYAYRCDEHHTTPYAQAKDR
eukprot:scaffold29325_cov127-Isochrysis_galbana.AAC.6